MELIITKTLSRRFVAGSIHDLPLPTWRHIAANVKRKLTDFTAPSTEAARVLYTPGGEK